MREAPAYDRLLERLQGLPGVGRRSAERIAFELLRRPTEDALALADAVRAFASELKVCSVTGMVAESDPCWIVTDAKRDHTQVLVVEQPTDVIAMEQSNAYRGSYHVLMGRLSPAEAVDAGELNIGSLLERVRLGQTGGELPAGAGPAPRIEEVILGTNPTLEGDGTALFLAERLAAAGVRVTRLARGMPINQPLQSASKAVLSDALKSRR